MTTEKIKISGVPPQWDEAEYEQRVAGWVSVYKNTTQSMELVRSPLPHDLLQQVINKANDGYAIALGQPVNLAPLNNSCWMTKPESMQEEDIASIRAEQKEKYVAHLEAEHSRYQDLLRQQLIQTQREKELKTQREKEAKQLAEIERQVQACYKPLQIPN